MLRLVVRMKPVIIIAIAFVLLIPLDAYSASPSELQEAYFEGRLDAGIKIVQCYDAALVDLKFGKEPDPSASSYYIVNTVINPYGASSRDLQDEWRSAFISRCSEAYMDAITDPIIFSGADEARNYKQTCYDEGNQAAKNGMRAEPQKTTDKIARSSPGFQQLEKTQLGHEAELRFISIFAYECTLQYNLGYEQASAEDIIGSVQKDFDKLFGETEKKITGVLKENTEQIAEEIGKGIAEQMVPDINAGGCLIATATYGSELAPQVQQLRELRDNKLLNTESGTSFMESFNEFYYSFSPIIADYERENPVFREAVKIAITPMISSLSILNYVDMDSEAEVLGYGISLIVLNVGMYVGIPAIVIMRIRK